MPNPYESPNASSREINTSSRLYVLFYKVYWPTWWLGTAIVALSWFGIVTPTVGWIGFALAGSAALGSYVLPSLVGVKPTDGVNLDSRLLRSKGDGYHKAIKRFQDGALLMYDGVAFGLRSNDEVACGIAADTTDLDELVAWELARHAQSVFDTLSAESVEFRATVDGRTFCISIMSGNGPSGRELCRVVDGKLDWRC
ncbi:hypothetical protein K227x_17160 [Rubripirellula lacrimiformis]|uniref:Uncharacterized protein n=1 Tax=Rubripirellula lacrimiformis TaxID=1930273 RepID=A0A517N869_9BACT|nr:hypothetical protein [Rubripirellula lacrimiformis]QDT03334.1 hypothetical protein K227x_17160 [Rubripirellula lacrimiformis]